MKVENGEKSIKTTILWKSALVVSALLVFLLTILGEAAPMGEDGPVVVTQPLQVTAPPLQVTAPPLQVTAPPLQVTMRPLSEFLDAQRTVLRKFFPPVPSYVGWTDSPPGTPPDQLFTTFALVDYAGLANEYLGGELGTQVTGSVTQTELADGRAQIAVTLFTTNALGFAQSWDNLQINKFKFDDTPTIFGNKTKDVANGAEAAVGQSTFFITFIIRKPGAPLPDLVDVLVKHTDKFMPDDIHFTATIPGECELGTRAVLHVDQAGPLDCHPPSPGCIETVEILHEPCS